MFDRERSPTYHPQLYLLAVERKGWRRWLLGRWAYSSEPFRRDIQRRCAGVGLKILLAEDETLGPEWEAARQVK